MSSIIAVLVLVFVVRHTWPFIVALGAAAVAMAAVAMVFIGPILLAMIGYALGCIWFGC